MRKASPTDCLALEDLWEAPVGVFPPQLPRVKERLPVDVGHQAVDVIVVKHSCAQESWHDYERERTKFNNLMVLFE